MGKELEKLLRILCAFFLIREERASDRKEHAAAVAYANAYDLLCYAMHDRKDCISMFDDFDEAMQFAFDNRDVDVWELEEIFRNREKDE